MKVFTALFLAPTLISSLLLADPSDDPLASVPVTMLPSAPPASSSAPSSPGASSAGKEVIRAKISVLTADIAEKQKEVAKWAVSEAEHQTTSQSPYRDIIATEQAQVLELQRELASN